MSGEEEHKALVTRFFEEVLGQGDIERVDEFMRDDYVLTMVGQPAPMDRQGHKMFVTHLRSAFPDWREEIVDIVAEGDRVVTRLRGTGTHTGEFQGIPATGNTMTIESVNIDRIADGKIAERWLLSDTFGGLVQLGVVTLPTA